MKKVLCPTLFFLVIFLLFSACAQREPADTTAGDSPTEATVPETAPATEPPSVDPAETVIPTAENVAELLEKAKERWPGVIHFPYLEAAIRGEIDFAKPKLTLEKLREICAESESFEEVSAAIYKIQPPDCTYGSGVAFTEFWGYGDGSTAILVNAYGTSTILLARYDKEAPYKELLALRTLYPTEGDYWYNPYTGAPPLSFCRGGSFSAAGFFFSLCAGKA